MKIIDYFAAEIPVISTSKGIEGIPAINDVHAMIRDKPDEIVAAISDLLQHPDRARALVSAGRKLAAPLDWRLIAKSYLDLFGRL